MTQTVQFHFDPLCPWAWETSKWMREVQLVRDIDIEWRLFSLKLVNEGNVDPLADEHTTGTPALRTLALLNRERGNDAVGALYEAIGNRKHEGGQSMTVETLRDALSDSGFESDLLERALDDEMTMKEVRAEHDAAVEQVGCFGVPTICVPSGRGMFGPVLSPAPTGEAAGELWDHVSWLIDQDGFFELKRERDREPGQ